MFFFTHDFFLKLILSLQSLMKEEIVIFYVNLACHTVCSTFTWIFLYFLSPIVVFLSHVLLIFCSKSKLSCTFFSGSLKSLFFLNKFMYRSHQFVNKFERTKVWNRSRKYLKREERKFHSDPKEHKYIFSNRCFLLLVNQYDAVVMRWNRTQKSQFSTPIFWLLEKMKNG